MKKGFTLIELLATIVVLAIIALVAVPLVLNIIESVKKGAAVSSARSYIKAIDTYMVSSYLDSNKPQLEDSKAYYLVEDSSYDEESNSIVYVNDLLSINGTRATDGYVILNNGELEEAIFVIDGYEIKCDNENCKIIGTVAHPSIKKGTEWVFDYTGDEQTFKVSTPGYYKIETWGAQGGSYDSTYIGGYGGYSTGIIKLTAKDKLYINVGGQGKLSTDGIIAGGYNGGGSANTYGNEEKYGTSGGGATHVATKSGLLSTLSNNTSNILIVAAGGGGVYYDTDGNGYNSIGGSGGGYQGGNGTQHGICNKFCSTYVGPSGGSQTSGGIGITTWRNGTQSSTLYIGSFGTGASGVEAYGGGGAGYYGGASGKHQAGAGGSGYIANKLLLSSLEESKHMTCYNCPSSIDTTMKTISTTNVSEKAISDYAKIGNGYVKITYIGSTIYENNENVISVAFDYTESEQIFTVPITGTYKLETWGAQGGSYDSTYIGGYGGYSTGVITLTENDKLYINVGGKGKLSTDSIVEGGYNGGGSGNTKESGLQYGSSGGGATHISTKSGLLSTLSNNSSSIIIVSGGGGGAYYDSDGNGYNSLGGSAGGYIGANATQYGTCINSCASYVGPGGGTQENGGLGITSWRDGTQSPTLYTGSFGLGATGTSAYGGGGAGYYGGASGQYQAGAGGSSYIANPNLKEESMYCYNCLATDKTDAKTISTTNISSIAISEYAKIGNGYAKITLLEL